MLEYIRDAAEIYRQSFAMIRNEADLSRFPEDVARVVVRMIHTCGQVDLTEHVAFTPGVVAATHAALAAGAPILWLTGLAVRWWPSATHRLLCSACWS